MRFFSLEFKPASAEKPVDTLANSPSLLGGRECASSFCFFRLFLLYESKSRKRFRSPYVGKFLSLLAVEAKSLLGDGEERHLSLDWLTYSDNAEVTAGGVGQELVLSNWLVGYTTSLNRKGPVGGTMLKTFEALAVL